MKRRRADFGIGKGRASFRNNRARGDRADFRNVSRYVAEHVVQLKVHLTECILHMHRMFRGHLDWTLAVPQQALPLPQGHIVERAMDKWKSSKILSMLAFVTLTRASLIASEGATLTGPRAGYDWCCDTGCRRNSGQKSSAALKSRRKPTL
jgi:hypothetical protein